jgi:3-methylcrotonyl-CoA carboxylase alpha subunit
VAIREVNLSLRRGAMSIAVDGGAAMDAAARWREGGASVRLGGVERRIRYAQDEETIEIGWLDGRFVFGLLDSYAPAAGEAAAEGRLSAPIPGRVVQVLVAAGDRVARGQVVAILEAMKTELRIAAPADGIVAHVGCAAGDSVEEGTEIVTLAPLDGDGSPP